MAKKHTHEQRELVDLQETAARELVTLIELVLGSDAAESAMPQARRYVKAMSSYALTRAEHDDASRHDISGLM